MCAYILEYGNGIKLNLNIQPPLHFIPIFILSFRNTIIQVIWGIIQVISGIINVAHGIIKIIQGNLVRLWSVHYLRDYDSPLYNSLTYLRLNI